MRRKLMPFLALILCGLALFLMRECAMFTMGVQVFADEGSSCTVDGQPCPVTLLPSPRLHSVKARMGNGREMDLEFTRGFTEDGQGYIWVQFDKVHISGLNVTITRDTLRQNKSLRQR